MDQKDTSAVIELISKLKSATPEAKKALEDVGIDVSVLMPDPAPEGESKAKQSEKDVSLMWVPWGVTSLSDLQAWRESQEAYDHLQVLVNNLSDIASNIFNDPAIENKPAALINLAEEFGSMVSELTGDIKALPADYTHPKVLQDTKTGILSIGKQPQVISRSDDGSAILYKSKDGSHIFYGRPTNRWRDRDYWASPANGGEIITDEAHKEFSSHLDDNPDAMPELWVMHEELTAFKNRAFWHDYSDGFMHFLWELTPDESEYVKNFTEEYSAGMSHGFFSYDEDRDVEEGLIKRYRMEEASLVPVELAANVWADFELNTKTNGMFTEDKREILINTFGEDWVRDTEKSNRTRAAQLDAHVDTKGLATMNEDQVNSAQGEEQPEAASPVENEVTEEHNGTQEEQQTIDAANELNEGELVKALQTIVEANEKSAAQIVETLNGLESRIKELEVNAQQQDQSNKTEGQTLSAFMSRLSKGNSVIGADEAHVPSGSSLAKQGPQGLKNSGGKDGQSTHDHVLQI